MNQMQQNSLLLGLSIGLLAPLCAHILTTFTTLSVPFGSKQLGLYVIAALINLFVVRYFYRKGLEKAARGVILITFVLAMLLIFTTKLSLT
ncbi:hypothetical protein [Parapedobacter indicus]|uniref:Uncharacterized protein n=1 Tax=Parapedobacter indicus TaxID=1477437 RepID=A0A1I3KRA6_9SPHI|nr:hypothetical protein [Parapedobacter indicus]PPL01890.1 hypothetical protein CLV26_105268 [Parapedobacter indicus]SFI74645.1 hypothetical protein SAMN05444682_105269 [Parapedobacter indicus]